MVKIVDDLARATELIQTLAGDDWDYPVDSADRDALVWLLEVAGGHAHHRQLFDCLSRKKTGLLI